MSQGDELTAAHGFQMPHVFVVPPEEDETPAWCCFDAALPIDKQIQGHSHLDADDPIFDPSSPFADESAAMGAAIARRNIETRSIVDNLMSKDFNMEHAGLDSDSDLDWDSDNEHQPHDRQQNSQPPSPMASSFISQATHDSDVVEVVKVSRRRRYLYDAEEEQVAPRQPPGAKLSGTFKARATKAFRSITGTLSFRSSKSRGQEGLPPRPSTSMSYQLGQEESEAEFNQSTVSRRSGGRVTKRLSQLFSPPSKSQPSLSLTGLYDPPAGPSSSQPLIASQSTSSSLTPRSVSYDFGSRRSSESIPAHTGTLPSRSARHTVSSKPSKGFSRLNLHKMFSFSSSRYSPYSNPIRGTAEEAAGGEDTNPGRTTPTLRRKSSSLPSTSTSSDSSVPQTPTTSSEDAPLGSQLTRKGTLTFHDDGGRVQLDFGDFEAGLGLVAPSDSGQSVATRSYSSFSSVAKTANSTSVSSMAPLGTQPLGVAEEDEGDLSFEMKLDSFHFDDISFDVDRFGVNLD